MRTFLLLAGAAAAVASAASSSTSSLSSASGSTSLSAELEAIPECNSTQLNAGEAVLTSNQRAEQCESALGLQSGTMLQVTTAQADEICGTTSCKAALQELYDELPNCRYNLWGLQYSAKKLLEYCGTTPTNASSSSSESSGSVSWSVTSSSASFAAAGATDAPSTASSTTTDSSATSSGSSAASTTTAVSAALAATAGLVVAYLA
ncbi:unnamed protein product [Phytophthora fragariaefolia]|uniref:Unnamed protein product n=1 Tax=Phytophthora fragariaefolia TaxID=1490495 RepID=A0A9W6WLC0_9STRA|nr:unnamed protein product [Phytophthora fragariaefolia]